MVVPDSVILGRLSKPFGAQPSNPWIVIGSEPGSFTGGAPFEAVSWGVETTPVAVVAERDVVDGT